MAFSAHTLAAVVVALAVVHWLYSAVMLGYHKDFSTFGFFSVTAFLVISIIVNTILIILASVYIATHGKEHFYHKKKIQ
jgi:hypothetical protein